MNTIIEKIKTWVNQRKKELHSTLFNDEYNDFLSFLSDLEKEEKPMELDFEQELYKHFGQVKDFTLGMRIGQYFYELGCSRTAEKYDEIEYKRQRAEESVPNDLEEAARYYLLNEHSSPLNAVFHQADLKSEMVYHKDVENVFIAGAKWQKEQMMKEAVEGRVVDAGIFATYNTPVEYTHSGDKVKLIIVKED